MLLAKLSFLHTIFLENKHKSTKQLQNNGTFHAKTSQSAKKMKIVVQKAIYCTPFLHKSLLVILSFWRLQDIYFGLYTTCISYVLMPHETHSQNLPQKNYAVCHMVIPRVCLSHPHKMFRFHSPDRHGYFEKITKR